MTKIVKDENGNIYHIDSKLDSGGQGCVFTVHNKDNIVIKALINNDEDLDIIEDEAMYEIYINKMRNIIAIGEFENVAIPYVMLEKPFCGYIMLFMNGLHGLNNLIQPYVFKKKETNKIYIDDTSKADKKTAKTKEEFDFSYNYNGSLVKRIKCLAKIAKILYQFENKGVVYSDIAPKNVFISKARESYEAWLIDLDNLSYSKDVKVAIGTKGYMAPEVAQGIPNTIYSDRYSFALLAYKFLLMKDPFEGKAQKNFNTWDVDGSDEDAFEIAKDRGEVAFIWEKDDDTNRSDTGLNQNDFLNEELIDLFEKTFNKIGRKNPYKRPSMVEWYDALINASQSAFSGTLDFKSEQFSDLILQQKSKTYFHLPTEFITSIEPFQKTIIIKKYTVILKRIIEITDDEKNVDFLVIEDKKINWNSDKEIDKYYLSNYDVMDKRPQKYIRDFISLKRIEKLFTRSNEFSISVYDKDYEVVAFYQNQLVKTISHLENTVIYIKFKGRYIKQISIE
jgi:serine/threonine protein kinase